MKSFANGNSPVSGTCGIHNAPPSGPANTGTADTCNVTFWALI